MLKGDLKDGVHVISVEDVMSSRAFPSSDRQFEAVTSARLARSDCIIRTVFLMDLVQAGVRNTRNRGNEA